jgi:hypothetical protein
MDIDRLGPRLMPKNYKKTVKILTQFISRYPLPLRLWLELFAEERTARTNPPPPPSCTVCDEGKFRPCDIEQQQLYSGPISDKTSWGSGTSLTTPPQPTGPETCPPFQRPNPKKNMLYRPELTITSPYVHSRVDSNTFTIGSPMPGSTFSPSQGFRTNTHYI